MPVMDTDVPQIVPARIRILVKKEVPVLIIRSTVLQLDFAFCI